MEKKSATQLRFPPKKTLNSSTAETGETLLEAAVAIPIVILLFMACMQLIQIGLTHIVVLEAAYEATRHYTLDNRLDSAQQIAQDICQSVSPGPTQFRAENGWGSVSHQLRSVFSIIKNVEIRHYCPEKLFDTSQERE